MINIKPCFEKSQQNELEYFNAIGLIFQNYIYLNRNDKLVEYEISDIKRVEFKMERNFNRNLISIMCFLLVASSTYALASILGNFKLVGFLVSAIFLLYSFLNKSYSYKIILITVNQNIVNLSINPNSKEQASKLVALIKLKIKKEAQYLKVS
jgi:hypothetical protein